MQQIYDTNSYTKKYKQRLSNELNDETFVGVGASNSKDEFNRYRVLYLLI